MISFNRQRNILDYALGSLWRNRLKSFGVALVFSLVVFMISSFSLLTGSLSSAAQRLLQSVPDITVQQMAAGRQVPLSASVCPEIAEMFGVVSVRPRIWGYYFDELNGANYTVIGYERRSPELDLPGIVYESIDPDTAGKTVIVGRAVEANMGLGDRRAFSLFRPDLSLKSFVKTAAFRESTAMLTDDLLVVELEDARDLFSMRSDKITDALVSVGNPLEIETIAEKIAARFPGTRVVTKNRIAKTYRVAFGWRSGFGLVCLFGAVAAFAILAWDKAGGLTAEQRREVGILKAVGWQTADVMTLRFWESLTVSLAAFCTGYLLGWLHVLWFDGYLFRPVLLGWSVLRPSVELVPHFDGAAVLLIFCLSVVPYLVATIIPAWRSAMIRPDMIV